MPQGRHTSLAIHLTDDERHTLLAWQRSTTMPAGHARRGRILLLLAEGTTLTEVAQRVGVTRRFVYIWAQRFLQHGLAGLGDKPGRGRGTRQPKARPNETEDRTSDQKAVDVIYYVAMSLDGYIAPADGSLAWLTPFEASGEDYGYAAFYQSIDAVLLGRHTFEHAAGFTQWPYPGKPCWVFSHRRLHVAQPDVEVTSHSPRQVMAELHMRGYRRAWLVGGGQLAGAFRAQGLITEHIITMIPIVLGTGIPLFGGGGAVESVQLVASQAYPNGLVQLRYRRAPEA